MNIVCTSNLRSGYLRILLATVSLYLMLMHLHCCSFLYSVSCLLDAADGYFARILDQSSTFGAVLDMVTDRCTTMCLLVFLAVARLNYAIIFQGLICLDFASHFMHMYAALSTGEGSHKNVSATRSRTLKFYYKKVRARRSFGRAWLMVRLRSGFSSSAVQ